MSSSHESLAQAREKEVFLETVIHPLVKNPLIRQAFKNVDRKNFIPKKYQKFAYKDEIIHLTKLSSLSQPAIVAIMIDHLEPTGKGKVLEIGTASGYNAAILSQCFSYVHTMEIDKNLASKASKNFKNLGYENISVYVGDGALGLSTKGPYDAIVVTASVKSIPQALLDQLADKGRIVIPVGENNFSHSVLIKGKKEENKISFSEFRDVSFYPLVSPQEGGWSNKEIKDLFSKMFPHGR